jgi:hypothetical protein
MQPSRDLGPADKPLRLGAVAFFVALIGVIVGFSVDYGPHNPWSYAALFIVVLGVGLGFVAVLWGWIAVARRISMRSQTSIRDRL